MSEQTNPSREAARSIGGPAGRITSVPLPDVLVGLTSRPRPGGVQLPGSLRPSRADGVTWLIVGRSPDRIRSAAREIAKGLEREMDVVPVPRLVSRFIGETEKNLSRALDAASGADVVLFFDEADALFGRRTEVRDSHDRYANAETTYLLDRLGARGGLAMLGCSDRLAIDPRLLEHFERVISASDAVPDDDG